MSFDLDHSPCLTLLPSGVQRAVLFIVPARFSDDVPVDRDGRPLCAYVRGSRDIFLGLLEKAVATVHKSAA